MVGDLQMKKEDLLKLLADYYAEGCKLPSPLDHLGRTIVLAAELYDTSDTATTEALALELLEGCGVELDDFFVILYGVNKQGWPDRGYLPARIKRHTGE